MPDIFDKVSQGDIFDKVSQPKEDIFTRLTAEQPETSLSDVAPIVGQIAWGKAKDYMKDLYDTWKEGYDIVMRPPQKPKSLQEFVSKNVLYGTSRNITGAITFPYHLVKGYTDPYLQEVFKEKPEFKKMFMNMGKHTATSVEELSRFMGDPSLLTDLSEGILEGQWDFDKAKNKWMTDPVGAVMGVYPLAAKGAGAFKKPTKPYIPEDVIPKLDLPPEMQGISDLAKAEKLKMIQETSEDFVNYKAHEAKVVNKTSPVTSETVISKVNNMKEMGMRDQDIIPMLRFDEVAYLADLDVMKAKGKTVAPKADIFDQLKKEVSDYGEEGLPVGMSIKAGKQKPKTQDIAVKIDNPEIEARFQGAKGIRKESFTDKASVVFNDIKNKVTRGAYEHLPRGGEFEPLRTSLLKLAKQKGVAMDSTIRNIRGITIDLDQLGMDVFRRKVIYEDLMSEIKEGRSVPFGFTEEILSAELSKVNKYLDKNKHIKQAIDKRNAVWDAIRTEYVDAMKDAGKDVSYILENENYFRHQVLDYASLKSVYGTGKRLKTPTGRGFLKSREGTSLDINTDYIQAEYEVMAQILYDTEVAKTINLVDKMYNIANKRGFKGEIPEGYVEWQPQEGNVFYMADTISSKLAQELVEGNAEKLGITSMDIKKSLAIGRPRKSYVVKEEVANTLDNLLKKRDEGWLMGLDRKSLGAWKVWQLVSPRRFPKYNFRNLTGDADAVFAGNPRAFLKVPKAFHDLYESYFLKRSMSPELQEFFNRGGFESTLTVQEIGDLNKLKVFEEYYKNPLNFKNILPRAWKGYWRSVKLATDFRESLLRYANFIDYVEQMKANNGNPRNFGASIPEEVMALDNIYDRAFKLQNDLLGAYDDVSVMGQNLSRYMYPFFRWKEVNFKRYTRLIKNATYDGRLMQQIGRSMAGKVVFKSPYLAYRIGKVAFQVTALTSLIHLWNNTFFEEEEKSLPKEMQMRPHLVFGKNEKGEVITFDRLGALGDFLSVFGLDASPYLIAKVLNGRMSVKEMAQEMAKSPVNDIVSGANPFVKTPLELLTRRSLFPDAFSPGLIRDRGQYMARSFGLENEYKSIFGLPTKGYTESVPEFFVYRVDPNAVGYYEFYDIKMDYLKKKGKSGEGYFLTPRTDALYNYKLALRYGDKEAANKYIKEYIKWGGTAEGLVQSLQRLHPLSGLNEEEKAELLSSLNPQEAEDLAKAIKFYQEALGGK